MTNSKNFTDKATVVQIQEIVILVEDSSQKIKSMENKLEEFQDWVKEELKQKAPSIVLSIVGVMLTVVILLCFTIPMSTANRAIDISLRVEANLNEFRLEQSLINQKVDTRLSNVENTLSDIQTILLNIQYKLDK